ncbi:MAG: L,D-transpeptidase family protein [Planctomycetota bacterium]|nr:L,D-transpeptidase family protein [Planctomycetota bacterium]
MNANIRQHAGFVAIVVGLCILSWLAWPRSRSATAAKPVQAAAPAAVRPAPAAETPPPAPAPQTAAPSQTDLDEAVRSAAGANAAERPETPEACDLDADVRSAAQASPRSPADEVNPPTMADERPTSAPAPEPEEQPSPAPTGTATPAPTSPAGAAANTGADLIWPKFVPMEKGPALEKLNQGLALVFKSDGSLDSDKAPKFVEARRAISAAYNAGSLGETDLARARTALTALGEATIFSRWVYEGDDLVMKYKFESGDLLEGTRKQVGLIRKLSLRVPAQVILTSNHVPSGKDFRAGEVYKIIRGPFHAIITKKAFTMDLYLQDTFVKQYKVAVGAPETPTPEGYFHVVLNGKMTAAPYNPPPNRSTKGKTLHPGDADYPLDAEGHNIRIEGVPAKGTNISAEEGFAVHGTKDPSSIGKSVSLGCVRLSPTDIKEVYGMLYEKWSTVQIKP